MNHETLADPARSDDGDLLGTTKDWQSARLSFRNWKV
jgi:hypothetical protein